MGATDIVLEWGEGNALSEIEGVLEVDDLAAGASRIVYVDHSAAKVFALPAAPVFSTDEGDTAGLILRVVERAEVGGNVRCTDGSGFVLEVEVDAGASGADKLRGTAAWDWDINWSRRGVVL